MRKNTVTKRRKATTLQAEKETTNMFGSNKKQDVDLIAFCIYDSKGTYGVPQFAPSPLSLIREYEAQWPQMVSNGSMLASHSEDYTIFKVGEFDRKTGKLTPVTPESVIGFHEIRSSVEARALRDRPALTNVN